MSRRRGSSVKRLSCLHGQDEENEYGMESRAGGERMQSEMMLVKSTIANFESKLNHLLMSSDKERQLTDLNEELKDENRELKRENKRLDRNNREWEKQLIVATNNYKNLTEKHTSATEMVNVLNEKVKDLTKIVEKHKKERVDLQQEIKILKDTANSLNSQLQTMDSGEVICERQQDKLREEKRRLHMLMKQNEITHTKLRDKLLKRPEHIASETKVMKLEMKLFRRNKLIEVLMERLKSCAPEFSMFHDSEIASYIDDDLPQEVQLSECDDVSQTSSEAQLTL